MWYTNYGLLYTMENALVINKIYNGLENISIAFGVVNEFRLFLDRPIEPNVYIDKQYLWTFLEDFSILRGRRYVFELRKIFKGARFG